MNNKGFTLIELLGVIVVLVVIMAIAVPSITGINNNIKKNMLNKKIELIEEAALLYGQPLKNKIISPSNKNTYNSYKCESIKIEKLVEDGYLDKDDENCTSGNCIVDPSDTDNYLDDLEVIIYFKNKRIYAKVDVDDNLTCS